MSRERLDEKDLLEMLILITIMLPGILFVKLSLRAPGGRSGVGVEVETGGGGSLPSRSPSAGAAARSQCLCVHTPTLAPIGGIWVGVWLEGGVGTGNASVCGQKSLVDCKSLRRNASAAGFQRCGSRTSAAPWGAGGGGEKLGECPSLGLGPGLSSDPHTYTPLPGDGEQGIERKRMLSEAPAVEPRGFRADRPGFKSYLWIMGQCFHFSEPQLPGL